MSIRVASSGCSLDWERGYYKHSNGFVSCGRTVVVFIMIKQS